MPKRATAMALGELPRAAVITGNTIRRRSNPAAACLNESLAGAGRVAIRTLQRPQQVQLVLAPLVGEAHPVMHSLPTRRARMRQNNLHTRGKLLNYR